MITLSTRQADALLKLLEKPAGLTRDNLEDLHDLHDRLAAEMQTVAAYHSPATTLPPEPAA